MSGPTGAGEGFTFELDPGDRPSVAVPITIAALTNREVTGIEPLNETIDPDALDRIFDGASDGTVRLEFDHGGCHIVVTPSRVRAWPAPAPRD